MAAFIAPVAKIGFQIGKIIVGNNNADKAFRDGWTQQQLGPLQSANPGKNIMIISVKHDASQLKGSQQQQMDCACPSGGHVNYTVYIFDEGVFLHQGDGGFLNWAFMGKFVRDGDKVSLVPIPSVLKLTGYRLPSRSHRRIF
jgi:hypothetical protein